MVRPVTAWMIVMVGALMAVGLGGCAQTTESFAGYPAGDVWTAMKAVAEEPDYRRGEPTKRWVVEDNQVWVDEADLRIEILRSVKRKLYRPRSHPVDQRRTWSIQVVLDPGTEDMSEPPRGYFRIRDAHLPKDQVYEAERYFRDILDVLGPTPRVTLGE